MQGFDVDLTVPRLRAAGGGYEVVHMSTGLEIGVYVLIAPTPDRQTPHVFDEVYVVMSGTGQVMIDGASRQLEQGQAVFVGAGVEHRFHDFGELALLVVFNGAESEAEKAT